MSNPVGKQTILLLLDPDPQPSAFDAIVAIDAGVDRLLPYGGVSPQQVQALVHGTLFTRGPADLHNTAIFVGGSNVAAAEALFAEAVATFFDPFRVSALLDPNGANTTAAAAVLCAQAGFKGSLAGARTAVLGGTGPVGQRVSRLLAREQAHVSIGSRDYVKAHAAANALSESTGVELGAFAAGNPEVLLAGLLHADAQIVFTAGAAGALLLPLEVRKMLPSLRVVIDLNAVPPVGIEGVKPTDLDKNREGVRAWGAIGVGGLKMKIHKKAIQQLFQTNNQVLDAEEVLDIGRGLGQS